MSGAITAIFFLAFSVGSFYFIRGFARGTYRDTLRQIETRRDTADSKARGTSRPTNQSAQAVIAELRSALASREETIKDLRERGKRAVADRDRWEEAAKQLQLEIAGLKTGAATAGELSENDTNKYRELRAALAKMFHPDALRSASNFERVVREELFKEINVAIDRINGRRRGP